MKNKATVWILVAVIVVLIGGAAVLYSTLGENFRPDQLVTMPTNAPAVTQPAASQPAATQPTPPEEEVLPDFTMYDGEGNPVKLSDFWGKPVVLNFWASWCGPCKSEMPDFQEAYETYGTDVQFLMVNLTDGYAETEDSAKAFLAATPYSFPVYFDADQEGAMLFNVNSIPTTYFIDEVGNPLAYAQGALDHTMLEKGLAYIYP